MSLNSLPFTRRFQSLHSMFCGLNHKRATKLNLNIWSCNFSRLCLLSLQIHCFSLKKKKNRQWPASNALLCMTSLQQSFLSRFCFNVSVIRVITYSPSTPSKLTETLLYFFNVIVLNSMFCLNCDNIVISGPLKSHCYIGNTVFIIISKIIISGFCPTYFTVTFAGT